MGVFSITPRSQQLGNISASGARQVRIPNYHIGTGAASMWKAVSRMGRDMISAGSDLADIVADMNREKKMIQDNETETAFLQSMQNKMEDPENGLLQRVSTAKDSDALEGCVTEGEEFFKTTADSMLTEKGYSGDRKKMMMQRLARAAMPYQRSMALGVSKKHKELKVATSDKNFNENLNKWNSHMTDEQATNDVIDSFRASQRVRGLADDAVDTNTEKIWQSMAYDYLTKNIGSSNRTQLDWLEQHLNDGNGSDLFAFNGVLGGHFANKDPLGHTVDHKYGGSVAAKDGVKSMILQRRRELDLADDKAVDMAANLGKTAVAAIRDKDGNYPADRLPNIEQSIETLTKLSKSLPQGGHAATDAATRASDLNAKADMVAQQEMIESYLEDLKKDPNAKIYIGETKDAKGAVTTKEQNSYFGQGRKERLAPLVQQMVDQQRGQPASQMRKQRVAELKMRMLSGARNPGDYHNEVFKAAKDGEIELSDYQSLIKEFDGSWAKGFEPGNRSPKQALAERMIVVIQKYFPSTELGTSYEWDDKTATMKLKKDATYQGLEYEVLDRTNAAKEVARGYGFFAPALKKYEAFDPTGLIGKINATGTVASMASLVPTHTTKKIDPERVESLINFATALSFYDGSQMDFDPLTGTNVDFFTGKEIKVGKDAPEFNAEKYFERYMKFLKDMRDAKEIANRIINAGENERDGLMNLRDAQFGVVDNPINVVDTFGSANDRVEKRFRGREMKNMGEISKSNESRRSSVVIRNKKTGEGVTTRK